MLSLKSVNLHPLLEGVSSLINGDNNFCDVTIVAGQSAEFSLQSNRFVLGAASPLLFRLLSDAPPFPPACIVFHDSERDMLENMIQYISTGETTLTDECGRAIFLQLMHTLEMDIDNCCSVETLNHLVFSSDLQEEFIQENETEIAAERANDSALEIDSSLHYFSTTQSTSQSNFINSEGEYEEKPTALSRLKIKSEPLTNQSQNSSYIQLPLSSVDPSELMQACEHCEKCFSSSEFLQKHIKSKHSVGLFKCSQCEFSTNHKSYLSKHLNTVHKKKADFECEICLKRFTEKSKVKRHKDMVHFKVKPFQCNHCNATFSVKHNRDSHLRTHTGERPFCCEKCGKSFASSSHLTSHSLAHQSADR